MSAKVQYAVLLLVLCLFGLLMIGCIGDPGFVVTGTVYEWTDAPSSFKGEIYIDEAVTLSDKSLQPLDEVHLYPSFFGVTDVNWEGFISESDGNIRMGGIGWIPKGISTFVAEKDGYHSVGVSFKNPETREELTLIILMVKEE